MATTMSTFYVFRCLIRLLPSHEMLCSFPPSLNPKLTIPKEAAGATAGQSARTEGSSYTRVCYVGCLKGVSTSVQVLFNVIEAVVVLTLDSSEIASPVYPKPYQRGETHNAS